VGRRRGVETKVDCYWCSLHPTATATTLSGDWTVFAAGISNVALFQAEMSTDAFQLMGMAERGYLPKIFATRSRFGTSTYGLLAGLLVVLLLGVSDLGTLVEMLNFNYGIALLMEYAAFVKLRVERPEVHRPYRIPLSTFGCCVFLLPPVLLTVFVLLLASVSTWGVSLLTATIGLLLYRSAQMRKCRECCYYAPLPVVDDEGQDMSIMNGDGIMRSNGDGSGGGGGITLRHMSS
jgi:amino acid transporter